MSNTVPAPTSGARPTWSLADRLRKAREDAKLEQHELAQIAGISRATISAAENGHRVPSRASLAMWAMATGVSRAWLTGDEDDTDPDGAAARMNALMAIITASRFESSPGHAESGAVIDAIAAREAEVQTAGEWVASSAIDHPEVRAWCQEFRPELGEALNLRTSDYKGAGSRPVVDLGERRALVERAAVRA